MPYTAPTAAVLKAQLPAFAAVADASIDLWLVRAARLVDESWPEEDFAFARMLLTAHYLTQQGLGAGAEAEAAAAGTSGFRRMKSGSLELERGQGDAISGFASTSYGRQFAELLRLVKGGPRVTSPGVPLEGAWDIRCGGRPLPSW